MPRTASRTVIITLTAVLAGCGGGGGSTPTSPSPTPGGTGSTPPTTATLTIGASGISPRAVTIARGGRVTVVNNDNRTHEIASDAHPNHTDCPEINLLGTLAPGQTGMTGTLDTVRVCGFHDHLNPDDAALRGTITIQ